MPYYPWSTLIWICSLLLPSLAAAQVHQPLEFNGNRSGFGIKAADPFDIGTGIYYRTYLDLQIDDTIPIRFERTHGRPCRIAGQSTASRLWATGGEAMT
jgi:hypothetical protein